ncbi:MAG: hypothetical protein GY953_38935 [bacterium]|nr:hypothetical protein [bacterium]
MTRYSPSRGYLTAGAVALVLAALCGWFAREWVSAAIPGVLFVLSAAILLFLASRPAIEIRDEALVIGSRTVLWKNVKRVDRTGWISPLVVHLTLSDNSRLLLIYPGDLDSATSLLRHLRRSAVQALIDGIPHRQFWAGEQPEPQQPVKLPSPRYRVLRKDDEAEVERLYRRLKTVGHLDSSNAGDEK